MTAGAEHNDGAQLSSSLASVAYLYDGSVEGLLSAVFSAYEFHETPDDIVRERVYEPRLGQAVRTIETDVGHAERVRAGIERACGRAAFTTVLRASTCDDYDMGVIVYRFIRFAMARPESERRHPVLDDLANPVVADLIRLERHALNESERLRQFARFSHLENGIWFARYAPNASVVPLVMGSFSARFNSQPFIIYDENHDLAGVYDGNTWQLVPGEVTHVADPTADDVLMQEAWKRFYDALAVDARYNPELRRQFMPVRLWSTITEMQPRRTNLRGRPTGGDGPDTAVREHRA